MTIKISQFDVSEYLKDEESIASYLSAILEEGDPKLLLSAISDVAKARGMSKIASDSGLGRESLYKALNPEAKPRFETILKVLNSLGVKIKFNAITEKDKKEVDRKYPKKTGQKSIQRKKQTSRAVTSHIKTSKVN
jgi:probable addiction module antidote protein